MKRKRKTNRKPKRIPVFTTNIKDMPVQITVETMHTISEASTPLGCSMNMTVNQMKMLAMRLRMKLHAQKKSLMCAEINAELARIRKPILQNLSDVAHEIDPNHIMSASEVALLNSYDLWVPITPKLKAFLHALWKIVKSSVKITTVIYISLEILRLSATAWQLYARGVQGIMVFAAQTGAISLYSLIKIAFVGPEPGQPSVVLKYTALALFITYWLTSSAFERICSMYASILPITRDARNGLCDRLDGAIKLILFSFNAYYGAYAIREFISDVYFGAGNLSYPLDFPEPYAGTPFGGHMVNQAHRQSKYNPLLYIFPVEQLPEEPANEPMATTSVPPEVMRADATLFTTDLKQAINLIEAGVWDLDTVALMADSVDPQDLTHDEIIFNFHLTIDVITTSFPIRFITSIYEHHKRGDLAFYVYWLRPYLSARRILTDALFKFFEKQGETVAFNIYFPSSL